MNTAFEALVLAFALGTIIGNLLYDWTIEIGRRSKDN